VVFLINAAEANCLRMGEVAGEKGVMQKQGEQSNNASTVGWERFLPRMALRVLLVESDDSTRQIIAALLRKCSYKGFFLLFVLGKCCLHYVSRENENHLSFLFKRV